MDITLSPDQVRLLDDYGVPTFNLKCLVFQVQSCTDASLVLAIGSPLSQYKYGVDFQREPNSLDIVKVFKNVNNKIKNSILWAKLNCHQYITMWVSWFNDRIEVGGGSKVGLQKLLSWTDSKPETTNQVFVTSRFASKWKIDVASTTFYNDKG